MIRFLLCLSLIFILSGGLSFGQSPNEKLMLGVTSSDWTIIGEALKEGADIEYKTDTTFSPLHWASQNDEQLALHLILLGADINSTDEWGWAPIHYAARDGKGILLNRLITAGAEINVNAEADQGKKYTPLDLAAYNKNLNEIFFLLKKDANKNFEYNELIYKSIPLFNNSDEFLLDFELYTAIAINNQDQAEEAIKKGADPNAIIEGKSMLMYSSMGERINVLKVLLNYGADVNIELNIKSTSFKILDFAAYERNYEATYWLLKAGANGAARALNMIPWEGFEFNDRPWLNDPDTFVKEYELFLAAKSNNIGIVSNLIELDVNPNMGDAQGYNGLYYACKFGNERIVKLLLSAGVDPYKRNNEDQVSPYEIALRSGNDHLVKIIKEKYGTHLDFIEGLSLGNVDQIKKALEKGASIEYYNDTILSPLYWASSRNESVSSYLVEQGAYVNIKDQYGWTPLHIAARDNRLNLLKKLISKRAKINEGAQADGRYYTPLDLAAFNKNKEACFWLLEAGGDAWNGKLSDWDGFSAEKRNGLTAKEVFKLDYGLLLYSKDGKTEKVKELIKDGASPLMADQFGWSALHYASRYGHEEVAKLLLEAKADPNNQNTEEWTPLHLAARNNEHQIVKLLIQYGGDLNFINNTGNNPVDLAEEFGDDFLVGIMNDPVLGFREYEINQMLWLAIEENDLEDCKKAINQGASVNKRDFEGSTPLHLAARKSNTDIIVLLIKSGADLEARNYYDFTPLHYAIRDKKDENVKFFLKYGADPNAIAKTSDGGSYSPLIFASRNNSFQSAKYLLDYGADLEYKNDSGLDGIQVAEKYGRKDMVTFLKDPDQRFKDYSLYLAIDANDPDSLRRVLETGANPNVKWDQRKSPLEFILSDPNVWVPHSGGGKVSRFDSTTIEMGDLILEYGGDINLINQSGNTPILESSKKIEDETLIYLIEKGADPLITDENGKNAFQVAAENEKVYPLYLLSRYYLRDFKKQKFQTNEISNEILVWLVTDPESFHNNLTTSENLKEAILNGEKNEIKQILDSGYDLNGFNLYEYIGISRFYPLSYAVQRLDDLDYEVIRLLMQYGADPNRFEVFWNSFTWSLSNPRTSGNKPKMAEEMIRYGADVNLGTNKGNRLGVTPLMIAVTKKDELDMEMVELLINAGADVNAKSQKGETALHYCMKLKKWDGEIISYLIENNADPNVEDNTGTTPFHLAVKRGDVELAELMLNKGADVNKVYFKDGLSSPLLMAVEDGDFEMVDLLIQNGANTNEENSDNQTPIEIVQNENKWELITLLEDPDQGRVDHSLISSVKKGIIEEATSTIKKGANINCRSNSGRTPLYIATSNNNLKMVEFLLKSGSNPNIAENDGVTPVMIAARNGEPFIVKALIDSGADIFMESSKEWTALYLGAYNNQIESTRLILPLYEKEKEGLQSNYDKQIQSAVKGAIYKGNKLMASYIEERGNLEWGISYRELEKQFRKEKELNRNLQLVYEASQTALERAEVEFFEYNKEYIYALNDAGNVLVTMGRIAEAYNYFKKAFDLQLKWGEKNDDQYITTIIQFANVLSEIGRYSESGYYYQLAYDRTLEVFSKNDYRTQISKALLGRFLINNNQREKGIKFIEEALASEVVEDLEFNILDILISAYLIEDLNEKAYNTLTGIADEDSLINNPASDLKYIKICSRYGQYYNSTKDYDRSSMFYQLAYDQFPEERSESQKIYLLKSLVKNLMLEGEYDNAREYLLEAIEFQNRDLAQNLVFLSDSEKLKYLKSNDCLYELLRTFVANYSKSNSDLNDDLFNNELYLSGLLLRSSKEIRTYFNNSNLKEDKDLYNEWQNLKIEIARLLSLPPSQREQNPVILENRLIEIEKSLANKVSQSGALELDYDWKLLQSGLDTDEVLIEIIQYNDLVDSKKKYYAAMIIDSESEHPEFIPLCEKASIDSLLNSMNSSDSETINELYSSRGAEGASEISNEVSSSLKTLIWDPIQPRVEQKERIYYIPEGVLNRISIHALFNEQDSTYLLDHYRITQLSSPIQILDETTPSLRTVTLMGGITYDLDTMNLDEKSYSIMGQDMDIISSDRGSSWSYLPGTEIEINAISNTFNQEVTVINGINATEDYFKSLSGNSPNVLHIATHGFFFESEKIEEEDIFNESFSIKTIENPMLRSGLIMAGGNYAWINGSNPYGVEDGILTAYEISSLDLSNTSLVVLSACETGLGDIEGSEGVYGLQRAFKLAGVENIIMSLWKVPDKQTVELMDHFYKFWKSGKSIENAFAEAQYEMRMKYDPYYWAAFVLVR